MGQDGGGDGGIGVLRVCSDDVTYAAIARARREGNPGGRAGRRIPVKERAGERASTERGKEGDTRQGQAIRRLQPVASTGARESRPIHDAIVRTRRFLPPTTSAGAAATILLLVVLFATINTVQGKAHKARGTVGKQTTEGKRKDKRADNRTQAHTRRSRSALSVHIPKAVRLQCYINSGTTYCLTLTYIIYCV